MYLQSAFDKLSFLVESRCRCKALALLRTLNLFGLLPCLYKYFLIVSLALIFLLEHRSAHLRVFLNLKLFLDESVLEDVLHVDALGGKHALLLLICLCQALPLLCK